MDFTLLENPDMIAVDSIRNRLREYNMQFWETVEKPQYLLTATENDSLVGGIIFSVFGEWLELEFLWVDQSIRGRKIGKTLLDRAEVYAKDCGCKTSSVNTMSFQAKPFYEKNGYVVVYAQNNYPKTSSRYYLEKKLDAQPHEVLM